jgi:transcription initiation factor TFIIB
MLTEISNINERCKRCGKSRIVSDTETGELFCEVCGFVMSEHIADSGPEWRSFNEGSANNARTGTSISLARHDMGLNTVINQADRDVSGRALSSYMKATIKRMRVWDGRSQFHNAIQRNYRIAFTELAKLKDKLALSDIVIEKAAYIYRKAIDKNLIRGRSISALIASSLYAACRDTGTPRTLKDVAEASNITKKSLALCYRVLVKELELKMPVVDSVSCVARIASKIGISEKSKRLAVKILKDYERSGEIAGKEPMGLAASALYISCCKMDEDCTQKKISLAANVTEVTIRNRCTGLKRILGIYMFFIPFI